MGKKVRFTRNPVESIDIIMEEVEPVEESVVEPIVQRVEEFILIDHNNCGGDSLLLSICLVIGAISLTLVTWIVIVISR